MLTAWLILLLSVPPPAVRAVTVEGNTAFSAREILSWLSTQPGRTFSEAVLRIDIAGVREHYLAEGYYDARVDSVERSCSPDSTSVTLRLRIEEGRRTLLGAIRVEGEHLLDEPEILGLLETRPGDPLRKPVLERDLDALLRRYEQLGHPFAECTVDGLALSPGGETDLLTLLLKVNEGLRMTIDEIRVEGATETDPEVIVRETRFGQGEQYDPARVDAIRPRLQRLNLFEDVADPELYVRGQKGGLLIRVREGNTNSFDGIVGYVPGSREGEAGYVTGLASVSMRNLFGSGRKFGFRWQREDRFTQELGLRYAEPWLFGQPVNLGGGFLQRKQDTTFVKRVLDLRGELMITDALTAGLLFSTESVIPSDTAAIRVLRSSVLSIGADVQYDTRNDLYSPTAGARYRTDYQYGSRRIRNVPAQLGDRVRSRTTIQRVGVDLDLFFSLFRGQVLALGLHGKEVRSASVDESEMFRFGGARSLRGYREGQFLGSRIAWTTTEYRFLLSRRSFLNGFVDTGYYYRPADALRGTEQADDFKVGYGLGLQVETGLGIVAVSFALGEGDTFATGKVHLGLINEF